MGIPPPLRSLMVIHPKLSPTVAAQLRLRGRLQSSSSRGLLTSSSSASAHPSRTTHPLRRKLHNTTCRAATTTTTTTTTTRPSTSSSDSGALSSPPPSSSSSSSPSSSSSSPSNSSNTLSFDSHREPRLQLTFTCTVTGCSERSTHDFTKRSYERGIVIVTCPNCKNRHLIADHLGWFKTTDGTGDGNLKTIEDIMRAKGEKVSRGRLDHDGVVEFSE